MIPMISKLLMFQTHTHTHTHTHTQITNKWFREDGAIGCRHCNFIFNNMHFFRTEYKINHFTKKTFFLYKNEEAFSNGMAVRYF